jgi:hypothetical protein
MISNAVSLKSMVAYERQTKNNALELFSQEKKSATDLCWLAWMIAYTKDNTMTFEKIENLSTEEFQKIISSIGETSGSV